MATPAQVEAIHLYAALMEEAKIRAASINHAITGRLQLASPLVTEYCFLQFRMISELVALGCLVAHGDIKATRAPKIQKLWSAEEIFDQLEALHPDFYPVPVTQEKRPPPIAFELVPLKEGFLTKAELLALVPKCGRILHRGNLKKLMKPRMPIQDNFPEVAALYWKFGNLLNVHFLKLVGDNQMICMMNSAALQGKVQVAFAERR